MKVVSSKTLLSQFPRAVPGNKTSNGLYYTCSIIRTDGDTDSTILTKYCY